MFLDEMTNEYRETSIDDSCQVSFFWLSGFRRED
jgi:hypothetical protein